MPSSQLEAENHHLRQRVQLYQDMVAFTGHEWRNQICVLELAARQLIQEAAGQLDAQQQMRLVRIQQSLAAMQRIARSYLNLVRVENAVFKILPTLVELEKEIIAPIQFSYADHLVTTRQTFQIHNDSPGLLVWADRDLLMSIYDNLVYNAIKYGEPGGKIICHVRERGRADELSVWNSGPGLSRERLETLFDEPFIHLKTPGTSSNLGIGLYLARKIVEAHGGRLWAESAAGAWVNFIFTLPKRGMNGLNDIASESRRRRLDSTE